MITGVATVFVRKGLSEEWIEKPWDFGYDDLPPETTWLDVERIVKRDINHYYQGKTEDRKYGKYWRIDGIHAN